VVGPNGSATDFSLSLDGPPPPPTLIATRQSNGSYQIQVTGVAGQSFIIQASSDSVNWVAIRTDTLIGTNLNFIETTAAGSRQPSDSSARFSGQRSAFRSPPAKY
jgi:hypothetical protein